MHCDTLKQDNDSTVRGDEGSWVGEVRAGTTSPMPEHKGFKLQQLSRDPLTPADGPGSVSVNSSLVCPSCVAFETFTSKLFSNRTCEHNVRSKAKVFSARVKAHLKVSALKTLAFDQECHCLW